MIHLLHSVDSLAQKNGGLPLAVSELSSHLAQSIDGSSTAKLSLITSRTDQASLQAKQVNVITTDQWRDQLLRIHQQQALSLIHQHGIWVRSSHTTCSFAHQHQIPLVLSPHGMLEPWALKHHSWRKKLALTFYQRRHLHCTTAFHATSEAEAQHIRDLGFTQPIAIIANGVSLPPTSVPPRQTNHPRTALFLSRLHPKKGVPMLLEAWAKVRPPDWKLIIAGNDEGGHLAELKQQSQQLALSSAVSFPGPLYEQAKEQAFQQADLFILPSHSENFAIVIGEALSHGLPVITTRETPWQSLEQQNCGWWVDAQVETIATALKNATELPAVELQSMGQSGRELIAEKFLWPKIAKQMISFYHWLIDESERPDFVI